MTERWIGLVVSGDKVVAVDAKVPEAGPLVIQGDHSWKLQEGDRALAYRVMHQQVADYIKENRISRAVLKASALSLGSVKKAHLEAAELRGVVMCAAASATTVQTLAKAHISRTFGDRKVDEYLIDQDFWASEVAGALRAGSREAAMILLAAKRA